MSEHGPGDVSAAGNSKRPEEGLSEATFEYLRVKAAIYLELGPVRYRRRDALRMPPESWDDGVLGLVRTGFEQIVQGRGLTPEAPLEGIGISGFRAVITVAHLEVAEQHARLEDDHILDRMGCVHRVTGDVITLYNLVEREGR